MHNIRKIDLNLLSAFDALYDERSVTRAAARLSLTQPTVSGMLHRLRHMFSDPLFLRSSHGILATPRAEAVAGPIKELLEKAHSLVSATGFTAREAEGTIKLIASDYIQHAVGAPLIIATTQSPFGHLYDLDKLLAKDPGQGLVGKVPVPDTANGGSARAYHDFYAGYDVANKRDVLYGAGAGGFYVYDITDLANPKLLTSMTGMAGITRGHSIQATPDARYAVV